MEKTWTAAEGNLVAAAFVPGLPHLVDTGASACADRLAMAMQGLGDSLAARGVQRLVYYSTQWISVLGHLFQARREIFGTHVDDNWHDLPDLDFKFSVDTALAAELAGLCSDAGYQTRLVDYDGFPIDTGTIVADRLLNRGRFQSAMVSCCVYSDFADTVKLAGLMRQALAGGSSPTALVCVSSLSTEWHTSEIDRSADRISSPVADEWNRKILSKVESEGVASTVDLLADYQKACRTDMGLKAFAMLLGMGLGKRQGWVREYGPLYGTGAAVIEF